MATLADLNHSLMAWIECVYHHHVHSATNQNPHNRYSAGLDHVRPADPETLRLAFLWRESRKARHNATISLQNNIYYVDLYLDAASDPVHNRQRHLKVKRLATDPPDPAPWNWGNWTAPSKCGRCRLVKLEHLFYNAGRLTRCGLVVNLSISSCQ